MSDQFIGTGLWSTLDSYSGDDNHSDNLDDRYSTDDVNEAFIVEAQQFIDLFMNKARHLFTDAELTELGTIEHDLWLTVEGHGAGFWDGDYVKGDELTEVVKALQPYDDYWGDKLNESIDRGDQ